MEVFDLGIDNLETVNLSLSGEDEPTMNPSSSSGINFGPGIELLMNDKKKSGSSSSMNIDLGELDRLESELNDMAASSSSTKTINANMGGSTSENKMLSGLGSMFNSFGFGGSSSSSGNSATSSSSSETDSRVGHSTVESLGNTKTWDGFSKMSDIPVDKEGSTITPKLTDREKRRKKRAMIKKLDEWYEKGLIKQSSHFNMDSNYEEVEDEYETALEDKRKKDSVKLQGWWFMTFINSLEYANTVFNPFDLNLDGWGEQVSEDIDSYEEIFSELHEKYKGGKLSPELSLLLRLGFSAAVVNITNKALSTATPGFNDVIRQSPELMKMFTNATVNSMSQQSPGFGFANNMVNQDRGNNERGNNTPLPGAYGGPPPPPIETKSQPPPQRPGSMQFTAAPSTMRPDITMGRGTMFREQGVDIGGGYESVNRPETPAPVQRPEMRGPQNTDLDNILAGLKPKAPTNINIHVEPPPGNDDSMISISSLKDLQNERVPKSSGGRRKQRSDKNVVSLDI
jgi:Family of unknown function (DUF5767)